MDKYIIIKASGIYGDIISSADHSFNSGKNIAKILIENFNFTYNQFLFPYIDALAVKGKKEEQFTMHFDTFIARADYFDEKQFKKIIKDFKIPGVLWQLCAKNELGFFEKAQIYTSGDSISDTKEKTGNNTSLYKFGLAINNDLFNLPDYKIREFSGKLCAFFEISAREIIRLGGNIVILSQDNIIFFADKNKRVSIFEKLFELYNSKLNVFNNITNSFFDEINNFN